MKNFKVKIWFGALSTEIKLSAANSASAITIAKRMYKDGRVISAQETK